MNDWNQTYMLIISYRIDFETLTWFSHAEKYYYVLHNKFQCIF